MLPITQQSGGVVGDLVAEADAGGIVADSTGVSNEALAVRAFPNIDEASNLDSLGGLTMMIIVVWVLENTSVQERGCGSREVL